MKALGISRLFGVVFIMMALLPSMVMAQGASVSDQQRAEELVKKFGVTPPNRDAFEALSDEEQKLLVDYFAVARIEVGTASEPAGTSGTAAGSLEPTLLASGCWTRNRSISAYNAVGVTLWTYRAYLNWCGNGTGVTSFTTYTQKSTPGWWWDFKSEQIIYSVGSVGWTAVRRDWEGKFQYCPIQVGCIQTHYPVISQQGSGNGDYWSATSW